MESFYGGRQGASFIIKKTFKYLDIEDPAYKADSRTRVIPDDEVMSKYVLDPEKKDFWYGEYCIIDSENKNNPNNGKIYRRTISEAIDEQDYKCAEYMGQIVGPSSGAAFLRPQPGLLNFANIRQELIDEDGWDGLGVKQNGELVTYDPSFKEGSTVGSEWPTEGNLELQVESINAKDKTLIPGAVITSEYKNGTVENTGNDCRDDIRYNWFNVRKNTENNKGVVESWCYIGFEVPYTVFSVSAKYKTPGTAPLVYETENSKAHSFWNDWRFEIPGGLRGISIEKIYISNAAKNAYDFSQLKYDTAEDTYAIEGNTSSRSEHSWLCEIRITNPNKTANAPVIRIETFYIGPNVEVKNAYFNYDTSQLVIEYYNKATQSYDIIYPKQINKMNGVTGEVTWTDSKNVSHDLGRLNFIDDAYVDQDHRLWVAYSDNAQIDRYATLKTAGYTKTENGKEYLKLGDTLALPEIKSGINPTGAETIEDILIWYNTGENAAALRDGALYIVTTQPANQDAVSYFIRWNPEVVYNESTKLWEGAWEEVARITSGGGIPAQLPLDNGKMSYDGRVLSDGAIQLLELAVKNNRTVSNPWS